MVIQRQVLTFLFLILNAGCMMQFVCAQPEKQRERRDSLIRVEAAYPLEDTVKADLLTAIAQSYAVQSEYLQALDYYHRAATIAERIKDNSRCTRIYGNLGVEYTSIADYSKAIHYHQKSLQLAEKTGYSQGVAYSLNQIGRVYLFLPDYPKALEYFQKALELSKKQKHRMAQAKELRNIGNTYNKMGAYHKALEYLNESQKIIEALGKSEGDAVNLGVIGAIYLQLGAYGLSMDYTQRAIRINQQMVNKRQESMNLLTLGKIIRKAPDSVLIRAGYSPEKRAAQSIAALKEGQKKAHEIADPGTEKTAWEELSSAYELQQDYASAYVAYRNYISLRDSIAGNEIKNTIAIKEMVYDFEKKETQYVYETRIQAEKLKQQEAISKQQQHEISLKQQQLLISKKEKDLQRLQYLKTQAELNQQKIAAEKQRALSQKKDAELHLLAKEKDLSNAELELTHTRLKARENQRNLFLSGVVILLVLIGFIVNGLQRTAKEKKKSDALLLNILPAEVAEELKQTGKAIAKQYNHVTVLFTDFVNFTGITEQMSPTELVQEIHRNFITFDAIIEKHGLEKIKTIGDAYLAVSGLPNEVPDHAHRVLNAAIEIRDFVLQSNGKFQVRIGIHSGPVVAGIVGIKKYAYDIWGDTVNTAARMEQHSESNKINISESTYELVKRDFKCVHRGKIEAKNKGEVDMYFVSGHLPV